MDGLFWDIAYPTNQASNMTTEKAKLILKAGYRNVRHGQRIAKIICFTQADI